METLNGAKSRRYVWKVIDINGDLITYFDDFLAAQFYAFNSWRSKSVKRGWIKL